MAMTPTLLGSTWWGRRLSTGQAQAGTTRGSPRQRQVSTSVHAPVRTPNCHLCHLWDMPQLRRVVEWGDDDVGQLAGRAAADIAAGRTGAARTTGRGGRSNRGCRGIPDLIAGL